ncbi:hypothetical protein EBT25_09470 [bacterium]|nr:hypothetical protein [bacterium]
MDQHLSIHVNQDLEDDTHMETAKNQEIVNVPVVFTDEMVDSIVNQVLRRMDLNQRIDEQIEYFMTNTFDINDYTSNLDTYDIQRGIIDDVIETIKDRL